jgi:hypothetical protein
MDVPQVYLMSPCYDGKPWREYCMSVDKLINEGKVGVICSATGDGYIVTRARNNCVWEFLNKTEAEWCLSVDCDIEFEPEHVYRLLGRKKDIVCGPYAIKDATPTFRFCVSGIEGIERDPISGLQQVREAGTGFKLIHRRVFEKLAQDHPELQYEDDMPSMAGITKTAFFIDGIVGRRYLTEDYHFDHLARLSGFEIWFDTTFFVWHHGKCRYPLAHQLDWLHNKGKALPPSQPQVEAVQIAKA